MVSFAAEPVFRLGFFSVTNSFLDTLLVDTIIIGFILTIKNKLNLIPGKIQTITETIIQEFYNITYSVAGENSMKIFPFFMTFFIFILLANWSGLIPGISVVGLKEQGKIVPFLRAATSDFNVTLALALVSIFATHILTINTLGIKEYISKYLSLNPLNLYIGILELIGEFTKIVSLSFRLFGNIFSGEVVLMTISTIFAFIFPLPFLLLEVVVGLVQALVFSMLTMAFMAVLMTSHKTEAKEVSHQ